MEASSKYMTAYSWHIELFGTWLYFCLRDICCYSCVTNIFYLSSERYWHLSRVTDIFQECYWHLSRVLL